MGDFTPAVQSWNAEDDLVDLVWHPQQNVLALLNQHTVQFMRVNDNGRSITLEQWGNTVRLGKYPMIGRFSHDGRHFLANSLYWGPDVFNTWTEAPNGTIVNVTLDHFRKEG